MNSALLRPLLAGFLALLIALPASAAQMLDRIVAVVNQDVVLASELEHELNSVVAQLRQRNTQLPARDVLERQVLERLILLRLQMATAERIGIRVDDATLNNAVQRIAEQNKLSLSEFRDTLQQEGIDFARFREGLRREITIARLHQRHAESQVSVTPQEIEEFLASQKAGAERTEYLVGHILISTPENASPEQVKSAREKAEAVRAELLGDADFAKVAAARSDSATALEGGQLGWRSQEELPTIFADEVPRLSVGQVAEVIQSPSGFHVIKLLDRRSGERQLVTQTHARHILIRPNEVVSEAEARTRLATLRRRVLDGGEDFGELARANSDDKASAVSGGDLGWASPGNFVPSFEEAMAGLAPGEISEPFQTRYGWHIVQVLGRREHDSTDEFRRARAAEVIRQRKSEEVLDAWLRRMRDEAYVDIRLES